MTAEPAAADPPSLGTATVTRDVALLFNQPLGREVGRLRRGARVTLLRVIDRRRGGRGDVWVYVRRASGYHGWMRTRDLVPDAGSWAALPPPEQRGNRAQPSQPSPQQQAPAWQQPAPRMRIPDNAWGRPPEQAKVPIVDMDFHCYRRGGGGHFAGCDLVTRFRRPPGRQDASISRQGVQCRVVITWTDAGGSDHQQSATASAPVGRMAVTLSYPFRKPAISALVDSQHCFAAGGW